MKRFLCAAFFMALVVLFAACGALNSSTAAMPALTATPPAASAATATPTSSTSRTQKSEPVQVKENPAKVDVVGEQAATAPTATAAPAQTPATGDFPVMYLAGVIGLILICSAGLLMLRKI